MQERGCRLATTCRSLNEPKSQVSPVNDRQLYCSRNGRRECLHYRIVEILVAEAVVDQLPEAQEAEKQAREGAVDTEAQRAALDARLADARRIIDSLITCVGKGRVSDVSHQGGAGEV